MISTNKKYYKVSYIFPILLVIYEIAMYLSNDAYLPALPSIASDLKTSHELVQLTLTSWFLGSASMQLFLGPACDHFGRRPVLFIGGFLFILSTIGCAVTNNIHLFLLLRFIQGASITSMYIAGYATIHELYEQKQAIHILGVMNSITILAPAFGPLVGALILLLAKWHWIFLILAIWAIASLAGLYFKMPETVEKPTHKMMFNSILLQYKSILTNRNFMLYTLSGRSLFAAIIAWITAGPFLLIDRFHFSDFGFCIAQAFIFGSFIIGTRCVKPLMNRFSLQRIIKCSIFTAFIGSIYALTTAILFPNILWNMIGALIIITFSSGIAFPILNRVSIEASSQPMGSRIAISSCLLGISGIVGSASVSIIYNGSLQSLGLLLFGLSTFALILKLLVSTGSTATSIVHNE